MPELPEVEVLRRSLLPHLPGRAIRAVEVHSSALREPLDRDALAGLAGRRVVGLRRRAKYLLVDLAAPEGTGGEASSGEAGEPATKPVTKPVTLVIHLGMSGQVTLAPPEAPLQSHEHLTVHLGPRPGAPGGPYLGGPDPGDGGTGDEHTGDEVAGDEVAGQAAAGALKLRFRDPRRFGQAFVLPTEGVAADRRFAHLGVEPLPRTGEGGSAGGLTGEVLREAARGRRGPVKTFLMNASLVVGVGNIYASEALWRAGVHPTRSVARISRDRWDRLAGTVVAVLEEAIAQGGTTLLDFRDGSGQGGYFQVSLSAYGREGEPCRRCAAPLRKIVQANRATYYCPRCQR